MPALSFSCSVPFAWDSWLHRQEYGSAYLALSRGERGGGVGAVRTKRADNVEVPKLLRAFAMIDAYGN